MRCAPAYCASTPKGSVAGRDNGMPWKLRVTLWSYALYLAVFLLLVALGRRL